MKRLFKLAEAAGDDAMMGRFLVAFDRLMKRRLVRAGWDWEPSTRQSTPIRKLRPSPLYRARLAEKETSPQVTHATRRYLAQEWRQGALCRMSGRAN